MQSARSPGKSLADKGIRNGQNGHNARGKVRMGYRAICAEIVHNATTREGGGQGAASKDALGGWLLPGNAMGPSRCGTRGYAVRRGVPSRVTLAGGSRPRTGILERSRGIHALWPNSLRRNGLRGQCILQRSCRGPGGLDWCRLQQGGTLDGGLA